MGLYLEVVFPCLASLGVFVNNYCIPFRPELLLVLQNLLRMLLPRSLLFILYNVMGPYCHGHKQFRSHSF